MTRLVFCGISLGYAEDETPPVGTTYTQGDSIALELELAAVLDQYNGPRA